MPSDSERVVPFKFSTTFTNTEHDRTYVITIKEFGYENNRKFRIYFYRLDKPGRVYTCTCCSHSNSFNLYLLRKRRTTIDNVYWPEFLKEAFIKKSYDISIIFNDFFHDAKMVFKKGDNKKAVLIFQKVDKKKLSRETFMTVQELNEKFGTLEDELKNKIEENKQLKNDISKLTSHFIEVNSTTLNAID
uniref:Uncharacterized protein n=1 Tax=Acrobeloides nanus TaxID=290746 RepID=A0A914EB53_9BILA